MLELKDINDIIHGQELLLNRVDRYIEEKNLNFIVAGGELLNRRFQELGREKVRAYLKDYAGCDFSQVPIFNEKPSVPFMAARMNKTDPPVARVQYLIDFNEEAAEGTASLFYGKILSAFATNFFAVQPQVDRLWFPFVIRKLEGSKMRLRDENSGTSILKEA